MGGNIKYNNNNNYYYYYCNVFLLASNEILTWPEFRLEFHYCVTDLCDLTMALTARDL